MIKKLLSLLLASIAGLSASADDFCKDGIYYRITSSVEPYTCEVTASESSGYSGTVTIAPSVTKDDITYSVTSIGEGAFMECSGLTSVTIPNSVTSIGNCAFQLCDGLTSMTIPNSVTAIGNGAFAECSRLTSIDIPESVSSIGYEAFYYCPKLSSLTIPNTVTSIGHDAFAYCKGLTSITVENDDPANISLGVRVFTGVPTSTCKLIVPNAEAVTSYKAAEGWSAFTNILNAENMIIRYTALAQVTPFNTNTFGATYNSGLSTFADGQGVLVFDNDVTSIGEGAFSEYFGLTSVTIPNSVTSIGEGAFYYTGLKSVEIPESVTEIGGYAFFNCTDLTSVEIPESVTEIGDEAFCRCSSLGSFTGKFASDDQRCLIDNNNTLIAFAPAGLESYTIPSSVTEIGNEAFWGCTGLTSVTIPSSVTTIGNYAFSGCTGLKYVVIPSSITTVGTTPFKDCTGLKLLKSYSTQKCNYLNLSAASMNDVKLLVPESCIKYYIEYDNCLYYTCKDRVAAIGDATDDNTADVTDIQAVAKSLIGVENSTFQDWAVDFNYDGADAFNVTIGDLALLVEYVLTFPASSSSEPLSMPQRSPRTDAIGWVASIERNALMLTLPNMSQYTSLQFDIMMPEGVALTDVAVSSAEHVVAWRQHDDGRTRVLVYSLSNAPFPEDGTLKLMADNTLEDAVRLYAGIAVANEGEQLIKTAIDEMEIGGACSAIPDTEVGSDDEAVRYYDIQGRRIKDIDSAKAGVYIEIRNGKSSKFVK